jgi:hypothetical protein
VLLAGWLWKAYHVGHRKYWRRRWVFIYAHFVVPNAAYFRPLTPLKN